MPFIPAADCALIEVLGNLAGRACEFTVAAQFPTGYELSDMVALAAAVDGWFNLSVLSSIGSDVFYEGVTIRGLDSEDDLEYNLSEPLPGGAPHVAWPAQCAVVVTKRTGFTGRSNRGRLYLWGLDETYQIDARHIDAASATAIQGWFDDFAVAVLGAGWNPVVLSYYHDHLPRVTAKITSITTWTVDTRIDTQRRRLGRS